jgi:hypothetical protein
MPLRQLVSAQCLQHNRQRELVVEVKKVIANQDIRHSRGRQGMAAKSRARSMPGAPADGALNPRQKSFVEQYLVDLNGTQAAIRAGYSPGSAAEIAYENLRKPHIAEAIAKALAEHGGIMAARIVDELAKIAFSDIRKVVSWRV